MPMYEWECRHCRSSESVVTTIEEYEATPFSFVCDCTGEPVQMARAFSFSSSEIFQPHFNASTGSWVTSYNDMADQMKRASEAATARTGIPTNIVPRELMDMKPPEVDI